ncbi:TetR/AcrR family transcriptional regulator [Saccharomonospora halophila]|uniref:TetR/AcrR family transcriptional regulator n=1 Tax=Saccharomonospora halophila TaxID=129922 RepID=UPI00035C29D4|nr:TetR/AcrR family transcriptional regulator [Saccharomonospora halophila]
MAVDTRERVHEAAVELFATRGFHGTGIRDLARASGVSTASLYHYMGAKEDLLAGIMRACLRDLLDAATDVADTVADPRERIRRLVTGHVDAHARMPRETRIVDHELHALPREVREEVVSLRDGYERVWSDTIAEGVEAGVFRTAHPHVTRIALLQMCTGVAHWYSARGSLSLGDLAGAHADIALRVLGACPAPSAEGRSGGE